MLELTGERLAVPSEHSEHELRLPAAAADRDFAAPSQPETRSRRQGKPEVPASALLAQLVEHFHGKEGVDGSSPSEGLGAFAGKSAKVGALRRRLAQRGRNSRPRSVHFVTPRASVVDANRPAVWSIPRVPPASDSFSASARLGPSCVPSPGGPEERWGPGAVARFGDGRDPSLGVTAARRGRCADVRPRGPP